MTTPGGATSFFPDLERSISTPRLDSYRRNGETRREAIAKYLWNARLCESLYSSLQFLEVSFRNSVNSEIATHYGQDWLLTRHHLIIGPGDVQKIAEAEEGLRVRGKTPITQSYLISELGFGFWTSLLDKRYHLLWHRIIEGVFPHMPRTIRKRDEASKLMNKIRKLRNAALHHHSIWHWSDLRQHHDDVHAMLGYICESTAVLAKKVDQFKFVHSGGHKQFMHLLPLNGSSATI